MAYTSVTLFSGGGGSSLGIKQAGFRELLAVDKDPTAIRIYKDNLPDAPTLQKDIANVSAGECLELMGSAPGELDLLGASPPCQGFSMAGKRNFGDPRNRLGLHVPRLVREIRPKTIVIENVKGMINGVMGVWFRILMGDLQACGYRVSAAMLDAQEYGVPQRRLRLFLVGVREDLGIAPSFPSPVWPPTVCQRLDTRSARRPNWWDMKIIREGEIAPTFTCHTRYFWSDTEELGPLSYRQVAGFPPDYKLNCGERRGLEILGNAVPPPLMYHIALHIRHHILDPMHHAAPLAAGDQPMIKVS